MSKTKAVMVQTVVKMVQMASKAGHGWEHPCDPHCIADGRAWKWPFVRYDFSTVEWLGRPMVPKGEAIPDHITFVA